MEKGHCPGFSKMDSVSVPFFVGSLLCVVLCFTVVGCCEYQRQQRLMRAQVRGILQEYMPLDENNKVESVGLDDKEGEFS